MGLSSHNVEVSWEERPMCIYVYVCRFSHSMAWSGGIKGYMSNYTCSQKNWIRNMQTAFPDSNFSWPSPAHENRDLAVKMSKTWITFCPCVLLWFIKLILGDRYGPGVSWWVLFREIWNFFKICLLNSLFYTLVCFSFLFIRCQHKGVSPVAARRFTTKRMDTVTTSDSLLRFLILNEFNICSEITWINPVLNPH